MNVSGETPESLTFRRFVASYGAAQRKWVALAMISVGGLLAAIGSQLPILRFKDPYYGMNYSYNCNELSKLLGKDSPRNIGIAILIMGIACVLLALLLIIENQYVTVIVSGFSSLLGLAIVIIPTLILTGAIRFRNNLTDVIDIGVYLALAGGIIVIIGTVVLATIPKGLGSFTAYPKRQKTTIPTVPKTLQPSRAICNSCSNPIDDSFIVCPYCGASLNTTCNTCNKVIRAYWALCPFCGDANQRIQPQAPAQLIIRHVESSHLQKATELFEEKRYKEALSSIRLTRRQQPQNVEAKELENRILSEIRKEKYYSLVSKGYEYEKEGDTSKALFYYKKAEAHNRRYPFAKED